MASPVADGVAGPAWAVVGVEFPARVYTASAAAAVGGWGGGSASFKVGLGGGSGGRTSSPSCAWV